MPAVVRWLRHHGARYRRRIVVSTPTAIRTGLREAGASRFRRAAETRVEEIDPIFSARRRMTTAQALAGVLILAALAAMVLMSPLAAIAVIELAGATFFLGVGFIRFAAAIHIARPETSPLPIDLRDAPVYTVLVPLRHEAHMVRQIVAGLDRLRWPRARLDIKLVIDSDDTATLAAARAHAAGPPYEVVVVPPGRPRTKPMALQYALTFARGALVTVYDAEDRPHPDQIREAFAAFRDAPDRLACLQAPLVIDNHRRGFLPALFAVEYAALFDGLLPALARRRLPLPLGGTSNHFRRAALEAVGGWDPFNVTEDADLGTRLARFGYEIDTITLPTLEAAPTDLPTWFRQRTRWQKGWLQTWLVHMRRPARLCRDLGPVRALAFNALGLGMLVSALAHPFFLLTPFLIVADPGRLWDGGGMLLAALAGLSLFNLAFGYAAMAMLATRSLRLRGRTELLGYVWLLPIYWLLMAAACLQAVIELAANPHRWNKTPHAAEPPRAGVPRTPPAAPRTRAAEHRRRAG